MASMASSPSSSSPTLPWRHHRPTRAPRLNLHNHHQNFFPFLSPPRRPPRSAAVAFRREDFETFKKRVSSGDAWRDAWRTANEGFEQVVYDARKAAERLDRRYSLSRRLSSAADAASLRVRELDRQLELSQKWRSFSLDFSQNWPRYRSQFMQFLDTPLGRSSATVFFLWFLLSGWLIRCLILASWVLPLASFVLVPMIANNLAVKGACPSCRRDFIGSKATTIRCAGCGNIVWQPQGDFFSKGNKGGSRSSTIQPDVIDVEFEEK